MAKTSLILPLITFLITNFLPPNHATFSRTISKQQLGLKAQDTQTHLTFYYHNTINGSDPTATTITSGSTTPTSPSSFGLLTMFDDPLTQDPDPASNLIGRAQGMYGSADLNVVALTRIMTFMFMHGRYSGSTLSVLGRDQVSEGVRELAVVGGTGSFRFAKGYVLTTTQTSDQDMVTGDSVLKFDVYVSHADSSFTASQASYCAPGVTGVFLSSFTVLLLISFIFHLV